MACFLLTKNMMQMKKTGFLLTLVLLFLVNGLFAQHTTDKYLDSIYTHSSVYQQTLINGREYNRYPIFFSYGSPYFITDSLTPSTFEYEGRKYNNVPLLYDMVADVAATYYTNSEKLVQLVKPKLTRFAIGENSFEYLRDVHNKPEGEYYQILYTGSVKLLKKDRRTIVDDKRLGQEMKKSIKSAITYYVYNGEKFISVNSLKALANALDGKSEALGDYVRKNKRNHKNAGLDKAMMQTAQYYDQLSR